MTEPAGPYPAPAVPAGAPYPESPTAPLAVGYAPGRAPAGTGSDRVARKAAADIATMLTVRAAIALAGAIASAIGAVVVFSFSRSSSLFGPFMTTGPAANQMIPVTAYSGPWIVGAGGLALLAGLLLVAVLADGYRAIRLRRTGRPAR